MSRRAVIVCLLLVLPYAYVALYWAVRLFFCHDCRISGDMIFYTLVLLFATPIVLIVVGGTAFFSAKRGVEDSLARQDYAGAGVSGGCAVLGLKALVAGGVLLAGFLFYWLDAPEPGRDRLGRICEESANGSRIHCRPDPSRSKKPWSLD